MPVYVLFPTYSPQARSQVSSKDAFMRSERCVTSWKLSFICVSMFPNLETRKKYPSISGTPEFLRGQHFGSF